MTREEVEQKAQRLYGPSARVSSYEWEGAWVARVLRPQPISGNPGKTYQQGFGVSAKSIPNTEQDSIDALGEWLDAEWQRTKPSLVIFMCDSPMGEAPIEDPTPDAFGDCACCGDELEQPGGFDCSYCGSAALSLRWRRAILERGK